MGQLGTRSGHGGTKRVQLMGAMRIELEGGQTLEKELTLRKRADELPRIWGDQILDSTWERV